MRERKPAISGNIMGGHGREARTHRRRPAIRTYLTVMDQIFVSALGRRGERFAFFKLFQKEIDYHYAEAQPERSHRHHFGGFAPMQIVGPPNRDKNKADAETNHRSHFLPDDSFPIETHAGKGLPNAGKRRQETAHGVLVIAIFLTERITQVVLLGSDDRLIYEKKEGNQYEITPRRAE